MATDDDIWDVVQLLTSPVLCKTAPATAWVERLSGHFEIQPEASNSRARITFKDPSTARPRSQETAKLDSLYLDARRKYKKLFGREDSSDSSATHDTISIAQEQSHQAHTPRKEKLKRTASVLSSFGADDENTASAVTGATPKTQPTKRPRLTHGARSLYCEEPLEVPYTVVASPVDDFHAAYSPSEMPAPHDGDIIYPYFDPYSPYELADLDSDDPIWVDHTEFVTVLSEDPEVNSDWRTNVVYGLENQIR